MKYGPGVVIAALVSAVWLASRARADEARPDFVLVGHSDAAESDELSVLAEAITGRLRTVGQSLLLQPVAAFEMLHSRPARRLDSSRLQTLGEALFTAREERDPNRLIELAHEILDVAEQAPEAPIDDAAVMHESARYIITQACFEGLRSYDELGKLSVARKLLNSCARLSWLVARDQSVRPDVRDVLLREVREYEVELTSAPSERRAWLQGAEVLPGSNHRFRTLPGSRLPVVVDCGNVRRTHWVVATSAAAKVSLRVDCAFDTAVHTDDQGLWLTSDAKDASRHALEVGRVLRARRIVLISKGANGYVLRELNALSDRDVVASIPFVHNDRQLATAVDELLSVSTSTTATSSIGPDTSQQAKANQRNDDVDRRVLWGGGVALGIGTAGELAGWLLYRKRSEMAQDLDRDLSGTEGALPEDWRSVRMPMLSVSAASSAIAATGAVLLASGHRGDRLPWWYASTIGVTGVGLAVWGIVDLSKGDACETPDVRLCVHDEQQRDRGALLVLAAVPLISLSVTKLLHIPANRRERIQLVIDSQSVKTVGSW